MEEKFIKKLITIGVIVFAVLVIGINSCSTIGSTERGVKVTFGKPGTDVLQSGLHFKTPFVQSIQKYDLTPVEYEKSFSVGQDGAISKDLQTVGVTFTLYWKYDENKIPDVVRNYKTKDSIYQPISTAVKSALKDEIGKYSIEEIIANQNAIIKNVKAAFMADIEYLPIVVTDFKIGNYDWDDSYDKMIKETMNRKQQVEQMKQDVALAEQAAQKQVKEAEARRQAAELDAQASVAKAEGEAQAKKIRADADAYEAKQIAANQQAYQRQWDYEIALEKAKRWNGKEVPDAAYIVPGTGAVVPLSTK